MTTRTEPTKVLVLSEEPMDAALLGMLLELEGYNPAYPQDGEPPETALARVRPVLVVLVDQALDVARSELFLARAARNQVGVAFFATRGKTVGPPEWARQRRVPWFRMPVDGPELRRVIEEAISSFRFLRTGADRRRPRTETSPDGTLIYHDRAGRRWYVYDRRGSDRRQADRDGHRAFVNDAGEEWRVELSADDFLDDSPAGLESQLAKATKIGVRDADE